MSQIYALIEIEVDADLYRCARGDVCQNGRKFPHILVYESMFWDAARSKKRRDDEPADDPYHDDWFGDDYFKPLSADVTRLVRELERPEDSIMNV